MGKSLPRTRNCPRCARRTGAANCCGIDLTVRAAPFVIDATMVRRIHALKAQKGLDEETYRLRLAAVGATSCKELSRRALGAFLTGLAKLPDRPGWVRRASTHSARSAARRARG